MTRRTKSDGGLKLKIQAATEVELPPDQWRVWIYPYKLSGVSIAVTIDPAQSIFWDVFQKLRHLTEVAYIGEDTGIIEFLAKQKKIKRCIWQANKQENLDFSKTHLEFLSVDIENNGTLVLTKSIDSLVVQPMGNQPCKIRTDDGGRRLDLSIMKGKQVLLPRGIPELRSLNIVEANSISFKNLRPWKKLERLSLWGSKQGTALRGFDDIKALKHLKFLGIYNFPAAKLDSLPGPEAFPKLEALEIDGISAESAATIKAKYSGFKSLSLRGIRRQAAKKT